MNKKEFLFVLISFLLWKLFLYFILHFSLNILPLQFNFLGGGLENYLNKPNFWAWSNFDGEHYLSIAKVGYGFGEQAFFPLYPLLINLFSFSSKDISKLAFTGLAISNVSFFLGLLGFYKLVKIDFSENIAKTAIILLLLFPTSFYFASVYTEGLFLSFSVWSLYFLRKNKWFWACILAGLAAATRVTGIILLPVLIIELWSSRIKVKFSRYYYLLLIPLGLFIYMFYLKLNYNDPLAFIHSLSIFGEQRSTHAVLLPQVFYRYIFKILPNINYSYFPQVFTTYLEFITATTFLFISAVSFFKLRLSYAVFMILGYLLGGISGSFSSLPRYVAVLFPVYILFSIYLLKMPRVLRILTISCLIILLVISGSLFFRAYWLS